MTADAVQPSRHAGSRQVGRHFTARLCGPPEAERPRGGPVAPLLTRPRSAATIMRPGEGLRAGGEGSYAETGQHLTPVETGSEEGPASGGGGSAAHRCFTETSVRRGWAAKS